MVIGPFLVDAASQTDSLSYAAAFVAGDQLILVHVAQPISSTRRKFDKIYKKAEADIKSLSENSYRLFDVPKTNIIECCTSNNRQLSASVLIVVPSFSVEFTAYTIPRNDNIRLMLCDEFISIFDDLEDLQEYTDYLEYKNRLASMAMPYSREIDKYAAFRYASGTLVSGANSPDVIYLLSGMGGDYRFDKLKKFWRQHPRVGWGADPTTWSVDDQKSYIRIYRRKDKFQNTLYTRLNRVDFFALSPLHLTKRDEEVIKTTDLLLQISVDYLTRATKEIGIQALVPFAKLKLVVYPKELLTRDEFGHLKHLDPIAEPWKLDVGLTEASELTIRLVLDKDQFLEFANSHTDNSTEIDFMLTLLSVLEPYHPQTIKRLVEYVQTRRGAPKRFGIDVLHKYASFPSHTPDRLPEISDFKLIDNEIAKIAKAANVKQGLFSKVEAIKILNQLRDLLKQELEEEIIKYDLVMSLPLLLGDLDSLTSNYELGKQELKLSLDRDVDFNREKTDKEAYEEYTYYARCYRYLIEKFVSLSLKRETALRERELQRLVALTRRLLTIYEASDIITYSLVTHQPRLRVSSDYSVKIAKHYQTERDSKQLAQEEAAFRVEAYREKVAGTSNHEAAIELINEAFLEDFGFEF